MKLVSICIAHKHKQMNIVNGNDSNCSFLTQLISIVVYVNIRNTALMINVTVNASVNVIPKHRWHFNDDLSSF